MGNITIVLMDPLLDDALLCHDCCVLQKRSFLQQPEVKTKIDQWIQDKKHHRIAMPINTELPFEPAVTYSRTVFSPDWPVPTCWTHLGPGPKRVPVALMPDKPTIEPMGAIKGLKG